MSSTNHTQLELVAQLTQLNKQLEQFVKGDADTTVNTNSGLVKSVAGIARDLERFRYVQKVIDHRLHADMVFDDIEEGMLIRVWGDNELNGLYKKVDDLDYVKVSYSDLYDLRDFLPNPWNHTSINKSKAEFDHNLSLFTYTLPTIAQGMIGDKFDGTLVVTVDEEGKRGSYFAKFVVHLAVGAESEAQRMIILTDISTIDLDDGFSTVSLPQIFVDVASDVLKHTFTFKVTSPIDGINPLPATLSLVLTGIDANKYKLI